MDFNNFKTRTITLLVIIISSILFLLLDSVGVVSGVYGFASLISVPVKLEMRKVSVRANDIWNIVTSINELKNENEDLTLENEELLAELSECEEVMAENKALQEQLGVESINYSKITEARVIDSEVGLTNTIQINAGSKDGIRKDDVVIKGQYLIGIVIRVEENSSRISLLTSSQSSVAVRGQKNRALGLASGIVGSKMEMTEILTDETIEENEIVVTSGKNSPYPANLIVGTVEKIEENPAEATKSAIIDVKIDFSKLDYVFVISAQR